MTYEEEDEVGTYLKELGISSRNFYCEGRSTDWPPIVYQVDDATIIHMLISGPLLACSMRGGYIYLGS